MDKDFARDIEFINQQSQLPSFRYKDKKIIGYLKELNPYGMAHLEVLDISERSVMTERIEHMFVMSVQNTEGDLDAHGSIPFNKHWFDIVIFSHVIEHLFNPLFCLENIKREMAKNGTLVIATPIKPHYLKWGKGHFHEFDTYRFKKLMDRAGLEIIAWHKFRNGPWWADLGIRPLLRKLFFKEQSCVILKIK